MNRITPDETNVKRLGRTYSYQNAIWCALSASGIEFQMTGTCCDITIVGDNTATEGASEHYARVGIYVDGRQVVDDLINESSKTYPVLSSEVEKTVVIRVIKLSEASDSTMGIHEIVTDAIEITPTKQKPWKIEYIGDSITCGYGVEGNLENTYSTSTENATKAYAYLSAQAVDADYSLVSFSGHGLISGYTGDGVINTDCLVQPFYEKLGRSGGKFGSEVAVDSVEWNFDQFIPDIVVINLGTNDASYCKDEEKCKGFQKEYVKFLHTVHARNPKAQIVCALGVMGDELYAYVKAAAQAYSRETGDSSITTFHFTEQDIEKGYGVDYHPCVANQKKAAEEMTQKLIELMK